VNWQIIERTWNSATKNWSSFGKLAARFLTSQFKNLAKIFQGKTPTEVSQTEKFLPIMIFARHFVMVDILASAFLNQNVTEI
tara:strand:- start:751 stop:996 length:246 start_codon:yes stop_codon:yes gene_type:complete